MSKNYNKQNYNKTDYTKPKEDIPVTNEEQFESEEPKKEPKYIQVKVLPDLLNVREKPAKNGKILETVKKDAILKAQDVPVTGWFEIIKSDGTIGYVMSIFTKEV